MRKVLNLIKCTLLKRTGKDTLNFRNILRKITKSNLKLKEKVLSIWKYVFMDIWNISVSGYDR